MQASIQHIKDELKDLYPAEEIDGFIRIIIDHVLGLSFTEMILQKERILKEEEREIIRKITARLEKHEPIQYILGETDFFDLKLTVMPGVLIPRPETEELVDWIIHSGIPADVRVLDIGTGSGCIPLAIKKRMPNAYVLGVDVSEKALKTARANAERNRLCVCFKQTDILNWNKQQWGVFDVIVSNPPYVRESEKTQMRANVLNYEPERALFVQDCDPLLFYRIIAGFAKLYLRDNGFLFFEINENLGKETKALLAKKGFKNIELRKDIEGKERMIRCEK